jgi:hypothetical protein
VHITVVLNPSLKTLPSRLRSFLLLPGSYHHIIHSGLSLRGSGCWLLQDGLYTASAFSDLLRGSEVCTAAKQGIVSGTIAINVLPGSEWSVSYLSRSVTQPLCIQVNHEPVVIASTGFVQFGGYLSGLIKVVKLNELLPASGVVGNIRFSRPTIYIFPGGQGDSALFGVSGFNLLVDGGYMRRSCFWDFTRHLDRIDALLITHVGADNLFGIASVAERKASDSVHPEIGHVFMNAVESTVRSGESSQTQQGSLQISLAEEASLLADNLKKTGLVLNKCLAGTPSPAGLTPLNLYHKVGHGSLDLYGLNPASDSRALKEFFSQWSRQGNGFKSHGSSIPLSNLSSVCALLVWKPSSPNDTVTRILFPGTTPQAAIFEAIDKMKSMPVFQHAVCTEKELSGKAGAGVSKKPPAKPAAHANTTVAKPVSLPASAKAEKSEVRDKKPPSATTKALKETGKISSPAKRTVKDSKAADTESLAESPSDAQKKVVSPADSQNSETRILDVPSTPGSSTQEEEKLTDSVELADSNGKLVPSDNEQQSEVLESGQDVAVTDDLIGEVQAVPEPNLIAEGIQLVEVDLEQNVADLRADVQIVKEGSVSDNSKPDGGESYGAVTAGDEYIKSSGEADIQIDASAPVVELVDAHIQEANQFLPVSETPHISAKSEEETGYADFETGVVVASGEESHSNVQEPVEEDLHTIDSQVLDSAADRQTIPVGGEPLEELDQADVKRTIESPLQDGDQGGSEVLQSAVNEGELLEELTDANFSHSAELKHEPTSEKVDDDDKDVDTAEELSPTSEPAPLSNDQVDIFGKFSHSVNSEQYETFMKDSPNVRTTTPDVVAGSILRDESLVAETVEAQTTASIATHEECASSLILSAESNRDCESFNVMGLSSDLNELVNTNPFVGITESGVSSGVGGLFDDYNRAENTNDAPGASGLMNPFETELTTTPSYPFESVQNNEPATVLQQDLAEAKLERDSLEREFSQPARLEDEFDPLKEWDKPLGLPAPKKLPGSKSEAAASASEKKNDGKKLVSPTVPAAKALQAAGAKYHAKKDDKDEAGAASGDSKPSSSVGLKKISKPSSASGDGASKIEPSKTVARTQSAKKPTSSAAPLKSQLKPVTPFYVDLAYVPAHGAAEYVDMEFFRRIRARYYVLSTVSPDPATLGALVDAKMTWEDPDVPVTIIPTYDADVLRYWMAAHRDQLSQLHIDVAPSANRCTIQLQDHDAGCAAFRLEF